MSDSLVVIGGGTAGWCAARSAQKLGANVILLELNPDGPGDTRAGPRVHASYQTPFRDPDELYEIMMKKGAGAIRPELVRVWADNTGRALQFMLDEGGSTHRDGDAPFCWNAMDEWPEDERPAGATTGTAFGTNRIGQQQSGTHRMMTILWRNFVKAGGDFRPGTRAVGLKMENGQVAGVEVVGADGGREVVSAGAVIMADGGWAGNKELMAEYVTTAYRQLGSDNPQGDCLRMALAVGAKAVNMEACYANLGVRPFGGKSLSASAFLMLNDIIDAGIVVDGHGQRIGDEAKGTEDYSIIDIQLAGNVFLSDTPDECWAIFDDAAWEGPGRLEAGPLFPGVGGVNPNLIEDDGPLVTAASLAELAGAAGLPAAAVEASVAQFNRFARSGEPIDPPRSGHPAPIEQGPFYAIPLIAGVMYTMGGPLIDPHGRVLNEQEQPIPGLYAAGTTAGGLEGGPHNAYAGGWSNASTFGLLAGEHAAGYVTGK